MTRPGRRAAMAAMAAVLFAAGAVGVARADGPADKGNPIAVPNGNPKELVDFILGLVRQIPAEGEVPANIREAVIKAADKVIAARPGPMELYGAVYFKTKVLSAKEIAAFENDLRRLGDATCPQVAHVGLLVAELKAVKDDPAALRKKIEEVKKFLDTPHPPPYASALAEEAAMLVERIGDDKLTRRTFKSLRNAVSAMAMGQDTPAYKMMTGVLSRLELPGHDMPLEGKTLEGRNFKLTSLKGKVVLVQFWASWCGACMGEVQNIKEQYKKYHDKGFEVVGISVDDMSTKDLAKFVDKEEMPWIICRDKDGLRSMAASYGVRAIPVLILVGRDGTVLSLRARGPELASLIEKALAGTLVVTPEAGDDKPDASDAADSKAAKEKEKAKEKEEQKRKAAELAARRKKAEEFRAAHAPKFREWSDASGSFHRTAKFRGLANRIVKLDLEDGAVMSVPLEMLSDDDQK